MHMAEQQVSLNNTQSVSSVQGIEYIELWVGNAFQTAHFYCTTFGFTPIAYAGPETGAADRTSYIIEQGSVRLVITAAVDKNHPIAHHVYLHGDSVKDIALGVTDVDGLFAKTIQGGATAVSEPATITGPNGRMRKATIAIYGDTVHTLINREHIDSAFLVGYQPVDFPWDAPSTNITAVDHVAVCVEKGDMERWVNFYVEVLGFQTLHEEMIETDLSAMNSRAIEDPSGRIKFVIIEPAQGRKKSQIEDYLDAHHGPGAQHIALLSSDIIHTIRVLRQNGILFRQTPGVYYDMLPERISDLPADIEALRQLHILADCDQWGYLLQIFARPAQARPTLFFEVIQREGARGFGSGNIKALFESIERERALQQTSLAA